MPVIIKMKGLPFESTSEDIKMFFDGLFLREEDIHLAAYKDGRASGIAFAVFNNDDDARLAMFRNENYMGKRYIELFLSSSSEMNTMLDEGVPDPKPPKGRRNEFPDEDRSNRGKQDNRRGRQENRLEDQRKGFNDRNRSRSPKGRAGFDRGREGGGRGREGGRRGREGGRGGRDRGRGGFQGRRGAGETDFGLDKRHVEVTTNFMPSLLDIQTERSARMSGMQSETKASLRDTMGSGGRFDRDSLGDSFGNEDGHRRKGFRDEPSFGKRERLRNTDPLLDKVCVRLQGLPFVLSDREVISFFQGLDVVQVQFLHHPDGKYAGKKTGEGYVEFRSVRDAMEARKKDREKLGHRYIDISIVTKLDMIKTMEKNEQDIKRAGGQRLQDNDAKYEHPISDLAIKIQEDILRQAPAASRILERGLDLQRLGISLPGNYGLPTESLEAQTMSTLSQLASTANISTEDVTAGCVVGIRNLPSSITAREIIDFFYGYSVLPDTVRIHYLSPGKSSGDAMITLRNSREAMAAVQELDRKAVGKRNVQLFLV